jgi:outer membrane protein assembly factor BamE (lipoprotein component of BamABCDE complex)
MMRYISVIVALFALTACMSMGTKVDQDKLARFEKGKTTYAEVVQQLGKPTQSTLNSDGTRTVVYTYMQSQAKAANFIPIVGAFTGGADTENTSVMLNFDKDSVLTNYSATQGSTAIGTGLSSGARQ